MRNRELATRGTKPAILHDPETSINEEALHFEFSSGYECNYLTSCNLILISLKNILLLLNFVLSYVFTSIFQNGPLSRVMWDLNEQAFHQLHKPSLVGTALF